MKRAVRSALAVASLLGASACPYVWDGCIARGVRVRTRKGDRAIEDVEVGDEVVCCDPETGQQHATRVTHVKRAHRECLRLAGAGFSLVCTSNHPLYDPEARAWAEAGDWALGRRSALLRVEGEQASTVQVTLREVFHAVSDVFDLTVEHQLHTFIAGGIVVHNKPPLQVSCALADGGTVKEYDACTCPAGGRGSFLCGMPGAPAQCANCDPEVCPVPDGGQELKGTPCTCDDGGTGGQRWCEPDGGSATCSLCSPADGG